MSGNRGDSSHRHARVHVPAGVGELIAALPKVELHVHLEGSMQPGLLLDLVRKHGVAGLPESLEAVREWYQFRDFPHFIEVHLAAVQTLRDRRVWTRAHRGRPR